MYGRPVGFADDDVVKSVSVDVADGHRASELHLKRPAAIISRIHVAPEMPPLELA